MSYLGRGLEQVDNIFKLDNITFNGGTTYALTKDSAAFTPISSNAILISIDGVVQQGNFSVSGTNIVFNFSPTSSNTCNWILHMGTGVAFTPADSSITKDKTNFVSTSSAAGLEVKGDGTTDGTLQLNCRVNSHGVKLKSPPHSAGQSYTLTLPSTAPATDKMIQTDGSGNLSFVDKPGGIYNLIAATDLPSEGTSFTMDNVFSDTYDKYLIFGERFRTGTNQANVKIIFRTGGSSGSDAGNNLGGAYLGYRHSANYVSGSIVNTNEASIAANVYNDTHFHFMMNVFYPTNTGVNTVVQGQSTFREGSTSYAAFQNFGYISLSSEDHTGFRIINTTGNFNSTACRLTVYGITDGA